MTFIYTLVKVTILMSKKDGRRKTIDVVDYSLFSTGDVDIT